MTAAPGDHRRTLLGQVRRVDRALRMLYGDRPWKQRAEPLDELILTVLSQHTTDRNRDEAFRRLKEAFPDWKALLSAPQKKCESLIRVAGLAKLKAKRLKAILKEIQARNGGHLRLDHLREMPRNEGLQWLRSLPGIGPKTAACLLLFSFGIPVFPVDTHIWRLSRRLGWIPERATEEKAHLILDQIIPDDIKYRLHLNLIAHGRAICRPTRPRCDRCCLTGLCFYFLRQQGEQIHRSADDSEDAPPPTP